MKPLLQLKATNFPAWQSAQRTCGACGVASSSPRASTFNDVDWLVPALQSDHLGRRAAMGNAQSLKPGLAITASLSVNHRASVTP